MHVVSQDAQHQVHDTNGVSCANLDVLAEIGNARVAIFVDLDKGGTLDVMVWVNGRIGYGPDTVRKEQLLL